MICFICKVNVSTFSALAFHYKFMHFLNALSTYECSESNCSQTFQNLNGLRRHITRIHTSSVKVTEVNTNTNVNNYLINSYAVPFIDKNINLPPLKSNDFNLKEALNVLNVSAVKFSLQLHDNNNFSRKDILNIQSKIFDLILNPIILLLKGALLDTIKDPLLISTTNVIISEISSIFKYCSSEYKLNKWLSGEELTEDIMQFTINDEINFVSHAGENEYDEIKTKGILFPLKFQFQKYYEKNDMLIETLNLYDSLNISDDNFLSNFIQGSLWKDKVKLHQNKIVLPYFIYIDDFEINNPLGSNANFQSISALYYSFPLSKNNSKISEIFLAALIKAKDLKTFGNDLCFKHLVNELNSLERDGISINTSCGVKNVHFILGLVIGDNLGLNCICDFIKSFAANFYCRFCKANKSLTKYLAEEDESMLRNIYNYHIDVGINDFKLTGVYNECILNQIDSFHVTTNYCVDIMHDLFEGVCHYNLCHILQYYISEVKIISLETLNNRKQYFNYGTIEMGNNSHIIEKQHLLKFRLKMSAREMMCFIHFLPLMIGDLIPNNDDVWLFFLNFLEIIDILMSHKLTQDLISCLKRLIKKHNLDYVTLFKDTLKPKHHFLIHYPLIIQKSGPPRHFWCFKYESKHRELKMYARAITSRKNITLSLAKKFQLKFADFLLNGTKIDDVITADKHKIDCCYHELLADHLEDTLKIYDCYTQLKFKGTAYKIGYYLTKFTYELNLYEILEIILINATNKIVLILKQIKVDCYVEHLKSYMVDKNKSEILTTAMPISDFNGPPININTVLDGSLMIRLKEYF
ncbi:unnamed protein product [Aphis gossypii]|uniref:C2H2-type domain-containing protein n=1 Tax=Aphis gossypii TaxID=80765 RepID=A0A9P0JCP4_APHGO|nr:unnamed protein product [Aphis gossypii]